MDHFCHHCLVFAMLLDASIYALWLPAGKKLIWPSFEMSNCEVVTFSLVS